LSALRQRSHKPSLRDPSGGAQQPPLGAGHQRAEVGASLLKDLNYLGRRDVGL
jgi:hypothetical protein